MKRSLISTVLSFLVLAQLARGQVPQTINYQGVLRDDSGNILDGNYDLTFRLYDIETGGTQLWSEVHTAVPVDDGIFNVILGSSTTFSSQSVYFTEPYWLEIAVGATTLTPRIELTAVPYSMNAVGVSGGTNVFPGDGDVGIGTTSPQTRLHILKDGVTYTGDNAQLRVSDSLNSVKSLLIGYDPDLITSMGRGFLQSKEIGTGVTPLLLNPEGGNVGIGTTDPTAKLEVVGNTNIQGNLVASGDVTTQGTLTASGDANIGGAVTIPATERYYSIPAAEFQPHGGGNVPYIADESMGMLAYDISAPVHLPHGAIITEFSARVYDGHSVENITVSLVYANAFADAYTNIITMTSNWDEGDVTLESTLPPHTVNNINNVYVVTASWTSPPLPEQAEIKFRDVCITYTVNQPLP